ncbi:secretion system protein [Halobacteriales archaeon QS_9_68_42]|nr:MAG: secretion system protein [Halobacteriales archaeon QS_1_68_44]PSQ40926.1 MAG: secretion system protein [Halobacteriales archaeon QS_9_68_42]
MNFVPMAIDDSDGKAAGGGKPTPDSEVDASTETAGGAAVEDAKFDLDSLRAAAAEGLDSGNVRELLDGAGVTTERLADTVDERTVRVNPELDEDAFFTAEDGGTTVVNRYDLERAVPQEKKGHFREVERYWVNEPYAFVIILHSEKENEKKYYLIEPHLSPIEADLKDFLGKKLKTAIKYSSDQVVVQGSEDARAGVIERETHELLERYDLYDDGARPDDGGVLDGLKSVVGSEDSGRSDGAGRLQGAEIRPEPEVLEEDPDTLTEYQIEKLLYLLKRDFIGFERIDGIKHDINIEDISCDGYNSPVFVYHSDYEQIISNVYHGEEELDGFVVKLSQRSGKGISKRNPQVDATLPDGSRSQLTLGREVSDHGTNYTIRQFKDVPFTPVDLVNWNTFSLEEMAFLWLCIENHKSLIFAGGTASGKTTSLNAVSLFIPSKAKIVSIEDTREVELPQRNWIASVTRPSFSEGDKGDVDEFDLLEAALRQRPEYIVMGEIRGEEGRTLFQVMSTGHTTLTTFHADSVGEVIKRFTTDPINVSKTMFTALDLVSIQTQTRVQGNKVRRNKSLTEINHYDPENDEINVQDVYQWQAETDEFLKMGESNTLDEIQFDRGWTRERLEREMLSRQIVLAYLIEKGLNTYTQVAATLQAFINDPESILGLIATDGLERSLEDLREMESVKIDIDPEKEAMVPRPSASEEMLEETGRILEDAEEMLEEYREEPVEKDITDALEIDEADDIEPDDTDEPEDTDEKEDFDYSGFSFEAGGGPEEGEATTDGGEASRASSGQRSDSDEASDEFGFDGEET